MSEERTVTVGGVEFRVTTEHAASSYGQWVVVAPDGGALGVADLYETPELGLVTGAQVMAAAERVNQQLGQEVVTGQVGVATVEEFRAYALGIAEKMRIADEDREAWVDLAVAIFERNADQEGRATFTIRDRDAHLRLALLDYAQAYRNLADELSAHLSPATV